MKRSSLLATVVGSALLMGGAMFTAPQVTANPSLLYLAGQAKMALGDTAGGLQLISRAARERQSEQMPLPQEKRTQTAQSKPCSHRSAVRPAPQPVVAAKAAPAEKKSTGRKLASAVPPNSRALMARVVMPPDPFNGLQEVSGLTREQVVRVTAQYKQQLRQWTERQRAERFEMAKLQKALAHPMPPKARQMVVKVVVPDAPVAPDFTFEVPATNP